MSFFNTDLCGILYDHPGFRDVYMEVAKRFYIKENDKISLKIRWIHRRDYRPLSHYYRIKIPMSKWNEFKIHRREQ